MNVKLVHLFPRVWQRQFGDEFADLLADTPVSTGAVIDVVRSAAAAHARRRREQLVWIAAVLAFVCCEVIALRTGITRNVVWAPTTVARGAFLVLTLMPIVAAIGVTRSLRLRS